MLLPLAAQQTWHKQDMLHVRGRVGTHSVDQVEAVRHGAPVRSERKAILHTCAHFRCERMAAEHILLELDELLRSVVAKDGTVLELRCIDIFRSLRQWCHLIHRIGGAVINGGGDHFRLRAVICCCAAKQAAVSCRSTTPCVTPTTRFCVSKAGCSVPCIKSWDVSKAGCYGLWAVCQKLSAMCVKRWVLCLKS